MSEFDFEDEPVDSEAAKLDQPREQLPERGEVAGPRPAVASEGSGGGDASSLSRPPESTTEEQIAFERGYRGEPAPKERALTLAWARGVWQRQAERMPPRASTDFKAVRALRSALGR